MFQYQCFVSECDLKFSNALERREHARAVHSFPKNYRFDELNCAKSGKATESQTHMDVDESDSSASKQKLPKIYLGTAKQKTFSKKSYNIKIPDACNNNSPSPARPMSPVTMFIPRQVSKTSYARCLTNNKQMETNVLESKCMMELGESLPDI